MTVKEIRDNLPRSDPSSSIIDSKAMVEFHGVSKNYLDVQALDNISFSIRKGDIFGYIGPNGSGKTTTIKILVGLIRNFQGDVYVRGKHIAKSRTEVGDILGYHPEEAGFQKWRTVNHTLKTFGHLSGLSSNHLEERIRDVLDIVNLADVRFKKIAQLSSGMAQKFCLAQALLNEPELLVLDEPLAGLDPASRFELKKIIKKLAKSGKTIFFSSHILSDVQDIATRIGILNRGKLLRIGTPDELQSHFDVSYSIEIKLAKDSPHCKGLENLAGIKNVEQNALNEQIVHLKAKAIVDECISAILKELINQGCHVRNFNLLRSTLEEVYLKFVGGDKE